MDGILIIDKAGGVTSHDVVQAIRKKFNMSKVGHLGTLDPMATGVLPVCVGKATRIAQFVPGTPKEYEGEIRFGFATDTYDREGIPTTSAMPLKNTGEEIAAVMQSLTGGQNQVPPPYSAKKVGGVPSHQLARRNEAVELAPARVEIQAFQMLSFDAPVMTFRALCSPGTYVRSLAHDLGRQLGCGAHLTALRRTQSGEFRLENAVRLDQLSAAHLIPLDQLLGFMPRIDVSGAEETKVAHGNQIPGDVDSQFARIFNKQGRFLAVASVENGWVRPRLVLTSTTSDDSNMLGCILEKEIKS